MKEKLMSQLFRLRELGEGAREYRGDAIWVTGKEKQSGEPLSIFYYGTQMSYDYLVHALFANHTVQRIEEDVPIWHGRRLLKDENASDLVVGDLNWPYYHGFSRIRFLRVPPNMAHKIPLPESWAAMEDSYRKRRTTREELRKVEKFGLSYRITNEPAAIERFYHTMYVPYAMQRHGAVADIDSLEDVLTVGKAGALIELLQSDRVVAGGILHRTGDTMRFIWLGILEGLDAGLTGATVAGLYCFTIQHAIAQRCAALDLLYTPGDLNNGIHRYKRKFGSHVYNEWRHGQLVVSVANLTPAAVSLFSRMPVAVAGARGVLNGRILIAKAALSPDDIRRVSSYYACEGLERLQIFSTQPLSDEVMHTDYAALDEQLPPLELHDLTKSANPAADFCRS